MPIKPENILQLLPYKPGVYQFIDSSGAIIYVGKAKNLKKRVSSLFYQAPVRKNNCNA